MAPGAQLCTVESMNRPGRSTQPQGEATTSGEYPAEEVIAVAGRLDAAAVKYWIDGGWGIDALLGHQTRPHRNLNLVVEHTHRLEFAAVMKGSGYHLAGEDGHLQQWERDDGYQIEVGYVETGRTRRNDNGELVYGEKGLPYPVGAFGAIGTIAETDVPCCHADYQMWSHVGHDDIGRRDMLALHRRFGLPLPD